jgi:hypothetical protein
VELHRAQSRRLVEDPQPVCGGERGRNLAEADRVRAVGAAQRAGVGELGDEGHRATARRPRREVGAGDRLRAAPVAVHPQEPLADERVEQRDHVAPDRAGADGVGALQLVDDVADPALAVDQRQDLRGAAAQQEPALGRQQQHLIAAPAQARVAQVRPGGELDHAPAPSM